MSIVRAIDVGYGVTKFVRNVDGETIDCDQFPSIAEFCPRELPSESFGARRRTVAVPFGDHFYEVGPDIHLVMDSWRPTLKGENYIDTPEYLALMRGALFFMDQEVIDLLVVGLPVAYFAARKDQLVKLATGEHVVGRGRRVTVARAVAVAQPQGALVAYASRKHSLQQISQQENLVIDAGTRTFDWVASHGMRILSRKSDSVDRGVYHILELIAGEISRDIGTAFTQLDALDMALRKERPLKLYGHHYPVERFMPLVATVARQAIGAMTHRLGDLQAFDNVVLAGGGAHLFRKELKQVFPQHALQGMTAPIFANVRGFQLAGQSLLASEQPQQQQELL